MDSQLLNYRRLPGRLRYEQAAVVIGCAFHDLPVLVAEGLVPVLDAGTKNSVKYVPACELELLVRDLQWLKKVTRTLSRHWQRKNSRRTAGRPAVRHQPAADSARLAGPDWHAVPAPLQTA